MFQNKEDLQEWITIILELVYCNVQIVIIAVRTLLLLVLIII